MGIASLVGAGLLMTIQAGVQSAIITTLVAAPDQAFTRWLDAVIGGGVALVISVLAPATGLQRPRQKAALVVQEIGAILTDTATALRTEDEELARRTLQRARASESMLDELRSLSAEGVAVVRLSPFRRRHLPGGAGRSPTCSSRWTGRSATCGSSCAGPRARCGATRPCRRHTSTSSRTSRARATTSPGSCTSGSSRSPSRAGPASGSAGAAPARAPRRACPAR